MYDVTIIGAGVVGAMVARTLSAYKLKICILEKENDVAMGATKANSAIVHAGFDAKEGSLKAKMNVRGSEMMKEVCAQLGVKYKRNGSLVVGFNDEDEKTINELYVRGVENGVRDLEVIGRERLLELEPNIADEATCALYAPTGAIVCPYELTLAAIGNAMDNGADLKLNFNVNKIERTENGFEISSDTETVASRFVVNAAGLYSDAVAKLVGDDSFEVHPRRGEYILLDKECGNLVSHTIFRTPSKMGKGILVSPTVDGNLLTGPTSVDIEDKKDNSTTSAGFSKIIGGTGETVKNIPYGKSITSFCGLRSGRKLPGDFIINTPVNGFVNAAGIESPGLSSSPAIAEYISELLGGEGLSFEKNESFNPIRKPMHHFREADIEEKNRIIKENPSYGRIICRCETVSEGEILDAIRMNPKARDLDGVKRRTRAQMGRCQGGFCSPYIIELIAKENNVAYEEVTKFGGNSYVNIGKTKEV